MAARVSEAPAGWDVLAGGYPDPPDEAAYHGLAGEIVRTLDPHTEADPFGMLITLLAAAGNIVGDGPHWAVSNDPHGLRVYPVLVGATSKGRKGTTWGTLRPVLRAADPEWAGRCIEQGLSSGEGLVWRIRDPIEKDEPVKEKGTGRVLGYNRIRIDPGVDDKRLFVKEEEFAQTLKVMGREGNTLSAVIRQAWDGDRLSTLTKNAQASATGAHVTILGHITQDELLRYLDNTEAANGFANRFLWACVRRSKVLPEGGALDYETIEHLGARLGTVLNIGRATGLIRRDDAARTIWHRVYETLSAGAAGLLGSVTSRAEAQVMRLACVYAVLDADPHIREAHLLAALAVWEYCEASAKHIFGDALGDPVADGILRALRGGGEMTQTDINHLFKGHANAARLERSLAQLLAAGKVRRRSEPSGGRPTTYWSAA